MKKVLLLACLLAFASFARAQNTASIQFLDDQAEPQFNLSFKAAPLAGIPQVLVFDYKDAKNFYALELSNSGVVLKSTLNGVEHKLASASTPIAAGDAVTLQRRAWLMRVLVGKNAALTAYDSTLNSGRIGFNNKADARVQPVEDAVYFNDDFTRQAGQSGEWKTTSGNWQITASSERINAGNQDMSANPFSYLVKGASTPAMVQAGRKFWDNYDAQTSLRPAGQGTVGLAFYVQDASNYLAFLWSSSEGPDARKLVKVEDGKTTVLAKDSGAYLPRQWYRVGVRTSPGFIETFLDGAPIFRVRDNSFGQGAVGLISQNTDANFDDVRVRAFPYFRQDFNGPTGGAWTPDGGFWRADVGTLNSASKPGDNGATRTLVAGDESWSDYQITASGKAGQSGACGLLAGYHDAKNFLVYRWAGAASTLPFHGRAQLLRYKDGKAQVLSDAIAPASDKDGFVRVALRFAGGAITVSSGDEILAQAADETLKNGRPGLWAQGAATVGFRDVVMFFPPEADPPKVAPRFEGDALMVGWASPSGEWPPRRGDSGLEFWNTGEFFGDASVDYIWRANLSGGGAWELSLHAKDGDFKSGTVVRVEGKDTLKISVLQNGQTLKSGEIPVSQLKGADANQVKITVELEGRAILVSAQGTPVLSYLPAPDASTPTGTKIAARATNYIIQARDLRAASANRDDYTFSEAPVDWYSPQGTWSVFHRWPCYSDWSFFGGKGIAPIIWNKREYSGDTVVEFYTHPQMNLPKEMGYAHPGDLNVTLCGDGKNLASGYSFVLAGWFNTKSAILKGNQIVAQNDSSDNAFFDRPINQNSQFHRKWFYVRAEARKENQNGKDGVHLKYFVDNQLMCEYFDPNPPKTFESGGRVAFWTVGGAMMIARAKIESSHPQDKTLPSGLIDDVSPNASTPASGENFAPAPVLSDGQPSAVVARAGDAWKISDPDSGGAFAVQLQRGENNALHASKNSVLDFDIALPPEVKVDAYFTIDSTQHLVEICGGQKPDASAPKLGAASLAADAESTPSGANWKHATFNLGATLHQKFPDASNWTIEKIEIGALHGDEYRWAGLFGNPIGASYQLKNFRVSEK